MSKKKTLLILTTVYRRWVRQGDLVLEICERQSGSCKGLIVIFYLNILPKFQRQNSKEKPTTSQEALIIRKNLFERNIGYQLPFKVRLKGNFKKVDFLRVHESKQFLLRRELRVWVVVEEMIDESSLNGALLVF
ncbi:hypothetical protein RhiirB3_378575 [Rhizophagus irregularis]|nr:hypothetical protein RhiirB3_378575 [Rhizophagus irregularis]